MSTHRAVSLDSLPADAGGRVSAMSDSVQRWVRNMCSGKPRLKRKREGPHFAANDSLPYARWRPGKKTDGRVCGTKMEGRDSSFAIDSGWRKGDEARILSRRRYSGRCSQSDESSAHWIAPNRTKAVSERDVGASGLM